MGANLLSSTQTFHHHWVGSTKIIIFRRALPWFSIGKGGALSSLFHLGEWVHIFRELLCHDLQHCVRPTIFPSSFHMLRIVISLEESNSNGFHHLEGPNNFLGIMQVPAHSHHYVNIKCFLRWLDPIMICLFQLSTSQIWAGPVSANPMPFNDWWSFWVWAWGPIWTLNPKID